MSKELDALARQKANVKELRNIKFIDYIQDFTLIEEALKRNEPMKVDLETTLSLIDGDYYNCPKCGDDDMLIGIRYNYCPYCGQKLDWSDEK